MWAHARRRGKEWQGTQMSPLDLSRQSRMRNPALALTVLGLALILGYQNCGPSSSGKKASESEAASEVPFAYEFTINRLAYMTCHDLDSSYNKQNFFTFRAGAYGSQQGGLRLTPEYLTHMSGKSLAEKVAGLSSSEINRKARVQFSLRQATNLATGVYGIPPNQPVFQNLFGPLSDSPYNADLGRLPVGNFLTYNGQAHGDLHFGHGDLGQLKGVRDTLANGAGILAFTFRDETDPLKARSPGTGTTSNTQAFGRGYSPTFTCKGSTTDCRLAVLADVKEFDLKGPTQVPDPGGELWDCPETYQFRIVRNAADATQLGCQFQRSGVTTTDVYRNTMEILGAGWQMDPVLRCLLPPGTNDCYALASSVDYTLSSTCDTPQGGACAQLVSICLRAPVR